MEKNLCGENLCGEKMTNMRSGFIKYLVCKVLNVIKWKNRHLGGFFVGFVGVVGLCG